MRRRDFLKGATAFAAGLACQRALAADASPNVVVIISDDQAWGDYGFMGHPAIQTPRIDKLASESLVFTRGYVTAPLCCPSLASMVTGLHPHQNGITSNDPPAIGGKRGWSPERLELRFKQHACIDTAPSLPRTLGKKNYLSLQTGKWWLGHYSRGGFTHGMTHGDPKKGGRHGDAGLKIGREGMKPITDFLDTAKGKPFFIWYAPFLPHAPHTPPQRLLDKYLPKTKSKFVARYWAMCEWFDETVGELLDILEKRGLAKDTMVLYICDNGWIQDPNSGRFAPRSKRSRYDGGLRTPIMVRWPGKVAPKRDETTPVSSIDLAPTVLAACGLEPAPAMQGVNLLDPKALAARDTIFGGAYSHDAVDVEKPKASVEYLWCVSGKWKCIIDKTGDKVELYDILADPHENQSLAAQNPDVVIDLRKRIRDWYAK